MALGPATGPPYVGPPDANELAGWRQLHPIPESSCFPGARRRTTSPAQARLPVMKRLMMVYIILAATAIVVTNAVPAEAELHTGITADLLERPGVAEMIAEKGVRSVIWLDGDTDKALANDH